MPQAHGNLRVHGGPGAWQNYQACYPPEEWASELGVLVRPSAPSSPVHLPKHQDTQQEGREEAAGSATAPGHTSTAALGGGPGAHLEGCAGGLTALAREAAGPSSPLPSQVSCRTSPVVAGGAWTCGPGLAGHRAAARGRPQTTWGAELRGSPPEQLVLTPHSLGNGAPGTACACAEETRGRKAAPPTLSSSQRLQALWAPGAQRASLLCWEEWAAPSSQATKTVRADARVAGHTAWLGQATGHQATAASTLHTPRPGLGVSEQVSEWASGLGQGPLPPALVMLMVT